MTDEIKQLRIIMNSNQKMSRGKYAAQAVHAALNAYGIDHDKVVVLGGSRDKVLECGTVIRDAGRTEVEPGTVTAGCDLLPVETLTFALTADEYAEIAQRVVAGEFKSLVDAIMARRDI